MEVVGITASVIAVLQITAKVASLSYQYISNAEGSSVNLKRLIRELQSLTGIITGIQNTQDPGSITLQGLDAPLKQYKGEIENLYVKLESKQKRPGWFRKLHWPLGQPETMNFIVEVERFKTSLILAMSTDQMRCSMVIGTNIQEISNSIQKGEVELVDGKLIEIVNWLFPEAFNERHNEISGRRKKKTGGWVLKAPEVTSWRKNPGLLWGYGIPGAGKTFLSSLIIDDLQKQASTSTGKCGVAYVYFNFTEQGKQQPIHVLASLVKQLACQSRSLPGHLKNLYKCQEKPNYEALYKALLEVSASFSETFFVFDALDECHQTAQRGELLPFFHKIVADSNAIHIFITSRDHPEDIQHSFEKSAKIKLWAKDDDITSYVEQKVSESPRATRLVEGHMQEIIDELIACANGMFLLVHFHIEYLCQQTTKNQILGELKKLKTSSQSGGPLAPTYDRVMQSIQGQPKNCVELATRILSWLVKAHTVLTVRELQLAVSAELSQTSFDEEDLPDQKTMLDVCGSLVAIDKESNTVRLVHYTVQEYLLKHPILEHANSKVAMACVGFLGSDLFTVGACKSQAALKDRMALYPLLNYAGEYLLEHLNSCEGDWREEVPNLLKHSGNLSSYFQAQKYYEWGSNPWDNYPEGHSPLHAAVTLGYIPLIKKVLESGDITAIDKHRRTPLHTALMKTDINPVPSVTIVTLLLSYGADASAADKDGRSALHYAAEILDKELVSVLLDRGTDISAADNHGKTALHYVLGLLERDWRPEWEWKWEREWRLEWKWEFERERGRERVRVRERERVQSLVDFLLDYGADASAADKDGRSALHYAAEKLDKELVNLLLDRGADISAIDNDGKTPLHYVLDVFERERDRAREHARECLRGRVQSLVNFLLDYGADVSAADKDGSSALHYAAQTLDKELVSVLLDRGADISAVNKDGETALHLGAKKLDEKLLSLLLDRGADISAVDNDGRSALHYTAKALDEKLLSLLLDRGADISAIDNNGKTALHYVLDVFERGRERMRVQSLVNFLLFLLGRGADASAADKNGSSALHYATKTLDEKSVSLLLDRGADISSVDNDGRSVLHYATKTLDEKLLSLLLDRGADISAVDNDGRSALHYAAEALDEKLLSLLLDRGADISAVDNDGRSALHYAAKTLDEKLVSLLLDRGADISAVDNDGKTALDYALKEGNQRIVNCLLTYRVSQFQISTQTLTLSQITTRLVYPEYL